MKPSDWVGWDPYGNLAGSYTLQGINISHLGKRKIMFKMPFLGDMLVPWRVILMYNLGTVASSHSNIVPYINLMIFLDPTN